VKPIRTILCVPGHDERKVARARDFGADLILWDLEDGVPAGQKEKARELVAAHARPGDAVRVETATNAAVDYWRSFGLTAWLPKLGGNVASVVRVLSGAMPLVALIETPAAVLALPYLTSATFGLAGLAFGRADFMLAVGARSIGSPLVDRAQEMVAIAAHALGVPCYDSPCEERDAQQAHWEADRAVACCYTGKGCIYPAHVAIVAEQFKSRPWDIERAERIVSHAEKVAGELFVDDGRVVAPPHVKAARELLSARG